METEFSFRKVRKVIFPVPLSLGGIEACIRCANLFSLQAVSSRRARTALHFYEDFVSA